MCASEPNPAATIAAVQTACCVAVKPKVPRKSRTDPPPPVPPVASGGGGAGCGLPPTLGGVGVCAPPIPAKGEREPLQVERRGVVRKCRRAR